jgi:histidine transport system permease protein
MMRHALPGVANIWQVILKATALVSLIGLIDLIRITQDAGRSTARPMFFALVSGALYLAISTASGVGFAWLHRRFSIGLTSGNV